MDKTDDAMFEKRPLTDIVEEGDKTTFVFACGGQSGITAHNSDRRYYIAGVETGRTPAESREIVNMPDGCIDTTTHYITDSSVGVFRVAVRVLGDYQGPWGDDPDDTHKRLVELRGGCACNHPLVIPPCGACSTPMTIWEAGQLGLWSGTELADDTVIIDDGEPHEEQLDLLLEEEEPAKEIDYLSITRGFCR